MSHSHSLEFTPHGIAEAGHGYNVNSEDFIPADPRMFAPRRVETPAASERDAAPVLKHPAAALASEPLDVLKAARARLKFVRSEVKKLRKLEREQAQLERLLVAAYRPLASVRQIKTSAG